MAVVMPPKENLHPLDALNVWYQTPLGQTLALAVHEQLKSLLPKLFGDHIAQFGMVDQSEWLSTSPIPHKIYLSPSTHFPKTTLCAANELTPLATRSIDVVVLPHILAFSSEPTAVLNEIDRILVADGTLIIIGFNPFGLWNLRRYMLPFSKHILRTGKFTAMFKIRQQLDHLGYRILDSKSFFYRPPVANPKLFKKLRFLETLGRLIWPYPGGLYLIKAKKETMTPMRVKPIWRFRNLNLGNPVKS